MPKGLDGSAQWLWKLVTENVPERVLSPVDAAALTVTCRWWTLWRKFDEELEDATPKQAYKKLVMAAAASKKLMEGLKQFGLSPGSRTTLKVPVGSAADEIDPLLQLMRMREASPN